MRIQGSNIVVTGGAGFIGSHLVRALAERGAARVTVVDSLRYGDVANLGAREGVRLVKHEIGFDPPADLERALEGADLLFHLAAEKHNQSKDSPSRVLASNVAGTLALYEAAVKAGVKKIVFTSSLYAYGRMSGGAFVETERCEPKTVYGISKLAGEHLLAYTSQASGVPFVVLRYLFIYGPKQFAGMGYKSVIMKSFERLLAGEAPVVFGDGMQALDYVYVDDAVEATILAATEDVSGEVLNVASGRATTVRDLIETMVKVSGRDLAPAFGPADWTAGTHRFGDPEKTARVLGWRATTSLEDGLRRTFDWIAAQGRS
ncbi:MAG: NAD-dependent epimerase/dehydratase family protein [Labilithrix sp.]|nr:NAD-dependent epimerase/dehydratase family protein [Labilithrix sp.]MCW5810268.1 NAD-dependent epimerase/dehydratase family protein [Labilithrix sp.]